MKVPYADLARAYVKDKKKVRSAIDRVVQSGRFILGKNVVLFEKEFSSYIGTRYGIGVASGTDALIIGLRALDLKKDDEVILSANSYPTAFAVVLAGALPVLVDIDEKTHTIDPEKIKKVINKKTKVIIPVHLYGTSCDMDPILALAKKHRLSVIEDCAQAHGAKYKGRKVGTYGDIACFSFYPTKNIGAFGDAGMLLTNKKDLASKINLLRMYGEKIRYESILIGTISRLDEIQAAVLRVKLKRLNSHNAERRKIARLYNSLLNDTPLNLPIFSKDAVYHLYVVRTSRRNQLRAYLAKNGVETHIHYPKPIHLQPSFAYLGYKKGDFPISEKLCNEILSLPCYPGITKKEQTYIAKLVRRFFS